MACGPIVALMGWAEEPKDKPAADASASAATDERATATSAYRGQIEPLLVRYCKECHTGGEPMGEFKLDELLGRGEVLKDREAWEKVTKKLHDREMPPEDSLQPEGGAQRDHRLD